MRAAVCHEAAVVLVGPLGVMEQPLALLLTQLSVLVFPVDTLDGLAVKLLIVGAGTGVALRTVIVRAAVVVLLPAASDALSEILWLPSATLVVFQLNDVLLFELVAFTTPSTSSSTFVTAMLSAAEPLTVVVPVSAAPAAGVVRATVGAVVSARVAAVP